MKGVSELKHEGAIGADRQRETCRQRTGAKADREQREKRGQRRRRGERGEGEGERDLW